MEIELTFKSNKGREVKKILKIKKPTFPLESIIKSEIAYRILEIKWDTIEKDEYLILTNIKNNTIENCFSQE